LNSAFARIPKQDLENVLGREGTKNLFDLAALGADPAKAKGLTEIARDIGAHLSLGGLGAGAGALIGHALPGGAVGIGIHVLYTHPEAGALVAKGLSKGMSPKVVVPAVLFFINDTATT